MKVGYFSDLCLPVNSLLDRRIDGIAVNALNKVFPDPASKNAFNINYNKKTLGGQKFKFSATVQQNKEGVNVTTGKFAAEPIYQSADLGLVSKLAIAKKGDRTTIEFTETYTKIQDMAIGVTLKVDKTQSVGVEAKYDTAALTGTLKITKGLDWKLFSKFANASTSDMDISASFLTGFGLLKEYVVGAELNAAVTDTFAANDLTLVAGYKASDWQGVAFARLNLAAAVEEETYVDADIGANLYWEVEKDLKFAGEVVVSPVTKDPKKVSFDYTVGACIPFGPNGLTQFRFGLDGKLGAAYTQWVNPRVLFSLGSAFDTADLNRSAFSFTLTLEA